MKKLLLILTIIILSESILAQTNRDVQVGSDLTDARRSAGAFFDLSEPNAVNIKVSIWGYVKYPGRYLVPDYTNVKDLLSYAGGPLEDANLDDIRLMKTLPDSSSSLTKLNYEGLLQNDRLQNLYIKSPKLGAGDILIIPGAPRYYYKDYIQMTLSVLSALLSITVLIVNLRK